MTEINLSAYVRDDLLASASMIRWSTNLHISRCVPLDGRAVQYRNEHRDTCYVLLDVPVERFWHFRNAAYVIDDGNVALPYYAAGSGASGDRVFLHPYPTNPGGVRTRPDTGDPADFSGWILGPRKTYHLKIRAA